MDRSTTSLSDPASQREGAIAAYGDGEIDVIVCIQVGYTRALRGREWPVKLSAGGSQTLSSGSSPRRPFWANRFSSDRDQQEPLEAILKPILLL